MAKKKVNTQKRGWWSLNVEGFDELTGVNLEHIAELIKQGYTSGEVLQTDESEYCDDKDCFCHKKVKNG